MWGPNGDHRCRLALDTGASITLVSPEVIDLLGYNPRDARRRVSITSAIGIEFGYQIRVQQFHCLGHTLPDFEIHAHDLPPSAGIDGLLGLDFLKLFDLTISWRSGTITAD